ncbi:hypothetical protein [Alkalibacillus aidingensis]|uniref:hypothetical protein n=1 Tax=Alkalibacillus aidingensis TaxID=2747607 RepID=UPI001660A2C0|nr:hypothetical protein [Alkalibacillus aidingensis]
MKVDEQEKPIHVDQQKKLSPKERISQKYGINKQSEQQSGRARSINELYNLRYKKKFR